MNLSEMRAAVRRRVGVPPSDRLHPDDAVADNVNEALHFFDAIRDWPWHEQSTTIETVVDEGSYDLDSSFRRTESLTGPSGEKYTFVDVEEIDRHAWERGNVYAITEGDDGLVLLVRPTPGVVEELTHRWLSGEVELSGDSDEPVCPARYHLALCSLAAGFAERDAGNYDKYQVQLAAFEKWERRVTDEIDRSTDPPRIMPRRGSYLYG